MTGGTRVGDVLAVLGAVAGVMVGLGYWQAGLGLFATLYVYADLRIVFLRLP